MRVIILTVTPFQFFIRVCKHLKRPISPDHDEVISFKVTIINNVNLCSSNSYFKLLLTFKKK